MTTDDPPYWQPLYVDSRVASEKGPLDRSRSMWGQFKVSLTSPKLGCPIYCVVPNNHVTLHRLDHLLSLNVVLPPDIRLGQHRRDEEGDGAELLHIAGKRKRGPNVHFLKLELLPRL